MTEDVSKILEMKRDAAALENPARSHVGKVSLYSFVGFLALSALLAIVCVLSGNFGKFEIKVLITTSVIAVASICSLCCSAYSGRTQNALPGLAGFVLTGVSAAMLISGVWVEMHSDGYWKTTAVLCVFAIACAHSLVLLSVRLRLGHVWLQIVAAINILALAAIISGMIFGEGDNKSVLKIVAVLAILAALETLVIPILGRLGKATADPVRETLALTKRADGTYEDKGGRIYAVQELPNDTPDGTRRPDDRTPKPSV